MPLLCPFEFPAGFWARPGRVSCSSPGVARVVIFVPAGHVWPCGFVPWLRQGGLVYEAIAEVTGPGPRGQAVCLLVAEWVAVALLATLPAPRSRGSATHGVLLPF